VDEDTDQRTPSNHEQMEAPQQLGDISRCISSCNDGNKVTFGPCNGTIYFLAREKQLRRMDSFFNNKHCVDEVVEIDYGNAGAFAIHRKVEDEVAGG